MNKEKMLEIFNEDLKSLFWLRQNQNYFMAKNIDFEDPNEHSEQDYVDFIQKNFKESFSLIQKSFNRLTLHQLLLLEKFISQVNSLVRIDSSKSGSSLAYQIAVPLANFPEILKIVIKNIENVSEETVFFACSREDFPRIINSIFPKFEINYENTHKFSYLYRTFIWIEALDAGINDLSFESQLLILRQMEYLRIFDY